MSWVQIASVPPQYQKSDGTLASGYYIKFYDTTNTPINMASDGDGSGLLAKAQLDASGYPLNGSAAIFIPHIGQEYKVALYQNSADADADTTANADWFIGPYIPYSAASGIGSATASINTIALLRAVTGQSDNQAITLLGHTTVGDGGGGTFRYTSGAAAGTYTDDNGITIVPTGGDGSAAWIRDYSEAVNVKWFGAVGGGGTDDTAAGNAAMTYAATNCKQLIWPSSTYLGNFSVDGAISMAFEKGCIFKDALTSAPIFEIKSGTTPSSLGTLTASVGYGSKTFTVQAGEGAGFTAGDLIYLEDTKEKTGTRINRELLVVDSVSTDTITVHDMIRSEMNQGTVTVYKVTPIENVSIAGNGALFSPTNSLTNPAIFIQHCKNPVVEGVKCTNQTGNFVRFQYCYNWISRGITAKDAQDVTATGDAFAVRAAHCRVGNAYNTFGERIRHVVDFISCYQCNTHDTEGVDVSSADVVLAHTAYGGANNAFKTRSTGTSGKNSCVVWADNGMEAAYSSFTIHDSTVRDVDFISSWGTDQKVRSVDFEGDCDNCDIENIDKYQTDTTATPSTDNVIVSIAGVSGRGCRVKNVTGNETGVAVACIGNGASTEQFLSITDVDVDVADTPIRIFGAIAISVDKLHVRSCVGSELIFLDDRNSVVPTRFILGSFYHADAPSETSVAPVAYNASVSPPLNGYGPYHQTRYENVTATAGFSLTQAQVQRNMGGFRIRGDNSSVFSMDGTTPLPLPIWKGQRFRITMELSDGTSARNNVTIPAGTSTVHDDGTSITLNNGNVYELQEENGSWAIRDLGGQPA